MGSGSDAFTQFGQWQLVTRPPMMVTAAAGLYSSRQIVYGPACRPGYTAAYLVTVAM
jgi:hypothetical protein